MPDVDELANERRNAFPFSVPAGESRAIWVEVFVPPEAPAGEYTGTVRVTWDGGAATVPVALTVWPFTLPSTASLKTAFGFTYGAIPSGHGVSDAAAFAELRERYGRLALDHRLTLSHVDDGSAALDHADSLYGPALDGGAPTTLRGARMTAYELLYDARSWSSYFDGKGWLDRLFQYTCDEPPLTCAWTDIPARAATARAANVRTLVTTAIQDADAHGVTSSIDVIVPVINYLDDKEGTYAGEQRAKYDAFLAASPRREIWSYQSCMSHGCGGTVNFGSPSWSDRYFTGWPSYMIDASAVRNRAMEWLSFRYRLTGELYYETAMAFSHDPWTSQWDFNGNGDGTLFYPGTPAKIGGTTHVPVASIRLKMIREGMEDYEYLKLLADAGDEALRPPGRGRALPATPTRPRSRRRRSWPRARSSRAASSRSAPPRRRRRESRCRSRPHRPPPEAPAAARRKPRRCRWWAGARPVAVPVSSPSPGSSARSGSAGAARADHRGERRGRHGSPIVDCRQPAALRAPAGRLAGVRSRTASCSPRRVINRAVRCGCDGTRGSSP